MASVSPTVLPDRAMLRRALESALRAPSIYNSQPWRWRAATTDHVDLFADPDRHLAVIDPDGRDLLLSCGAALHHLVVALAGLGWSAQVDRFPEPEDTHHLARIRPLTTSPSPDTARLARAIALRRTDRRRFSARPVDDALLEALIEHAGACGMQLHVVAGNAAREGLIQIMTLSASLQQQQAGYAAELAQWTSRYVYSDDGIDSGSVPGGVEQAGEVPMRAFPQAGLAQSPHSFEHDDASVLMVLCSPRDDRLGALSAGEAASAVLLAATNMGLASTPLSQPLEVAQTRAWIRDRFVGHRLFPYLVLRIGWAQPGCPELPPTPRRSLKFVLRER
jgi:nitroreductase